MYPESYELVVGDTMGIFDKSINQDIRNFQLIEPFGKPDNAVAELRRNDDPLAVCLLKTGNQRVEAAPVILVEVQLLDLHVVTEQLLGCFVDTFAQLVPIFTLCERGNQCGEAVPLLQRERTGDEVRVVVNLFQNLFHLPLCLFRNLSPFVEDAVYRAGRNTRQGGDVFYAISLHRLN